MNAPSVKTTAIAIGVLEARDAELAAVRASLTSAEQMIAERDARIAELEAALSELVDIVNGHLDDGDRLDSFTLQPANRVLHGGTFDPHGVPAQAPQSAGALHDGELPDTEGGSCD